jgi:hypothetical protein
MSRTAVVVLLSLFAGCGEEPPERGPNLLILSIDDLENCGTAAAESTASERIEFEHHYADAPFSLGIPALAQRFAQNHYETFALTFHEPPAALREFPFSFDLHQSMDDRTQEEGLATFHSWRQETSSPWFAYLHLPVCPTPENQFLDEATLLILTSDRAERHPAQTVPLQILTGAAVPSLTAAPLSSHTGLALALSNLLTDKFHMPAVSALHFQTNGRSFLIEPPVVCVASGTEIQLYRIDTDPDLQHDLATEEPTMTASCRSRLAQAENEPDDPLERERLEDLRSLGYIH